MPTRLTVRAIAWERVNLTLMLSAMWEDPTRGEKTPVRPGERAPGASASAVPPSPKVSTEVPAEDIDEGPGGAEAVSPQGADPSTRSKQPSAHEALADDTPGAATAPQIVEIFIRDIVKAHPVTWTYEGAGRYRVDVNITNFARRRFLPVGTWKVFARLSTGAEVGATFDLTRLDELDESSRVFLFSGNKQAYTVSFGVTENDTDPLFAMRAYDFSRGRRSRHKSLNPVSRVKGFAKDITSPQRRRRLAQTIYNRTREDDALVRALRDRRGTPQRPRILFASEMRPGLEGNLLAIRDRMVERGLDRDFEFMYSFRTTRTATSRTFFSLIRELARADIVLIDDYFAPLEWLKLSPDCRIIQVWHAGSGFKSVGYSRFGQFGSPALTNAHRKYTYAITGARHLKPVYAEVFGIEQEAVIPTGLPRIDSFLDPAAQTRAKKKVYDTFPILKGKRVILFAPTFRGRGVQHAHYDYSQIDFKALYDLCGDDTVVAFRMHHFIPDKVPIPPSMRDRFVDVAGYRNGNDLLLVTDLLITDYSSIIYEYSLLHRPMLFFAYDEQPYSAVRGFHRPYEDTAPGKVCHTFTELLEAIRTEDFETERGDAFRRDNFDNIDTHSSDRVINWLILGDPPADAVRPEPRTHAAVGSSGEESSL